MITVKVDLSRFSTDIENKISRAVKDEKTRLTVHNLLAKMCDPYVPMQTGVMAQTTNITSEGVTYTAPYSHYQYTGEVYGPNIPIMQDGVITGWFSPPGKPKHPTGAAISYSTEMHPLATSHWDEAMLRDKKDEFESGIKDIIIRRYHEIYG